MVLPGNRPACLLRLKIPSHDIKGKTDCSVRPVSNKGCFSRPLCQGSTSNVTKEQAVIKLLVFLLAVPTTLSPREEKEGSGQDSKATKISMAKQDSKREQFIVRSISSSKVTQTPLLLPKSHGQGVTMVMTPRRSSVHTWCLFPGKDLCPHHPCPHHPCPYHLTVEIRHQPWISTTEMQTPMGGGGSKQ